MRSLVLISLFALIATQTTGCVITSGDDEGGFCGDGFVDGGETCDDENNASGDGCSATCQTEGSAVGLITANWSFKELATNQTLGCPTGFNTAAVTAQPVDAAGNNAGEPIIDLYTCSDLTGTAEYPLGIYKVFIDITTETNSSSYSQSLSAIVDITDSDKTFTATLLEDGGYFIFDWTLRGAVSNQTLTCAEAGNPDSIEIASTLIGPSTLVADKFNCADRTGVTGGLIEGDYTVSISALDTQDAPIGMAPAMNTAIRPLNAVTDLGTVEIAIDGQ